MIYSILNTTTIGQTNADTDHKPHRLPYINRQKRDSHFLYSFWQFINPIKQPIAIIMGVKIISMG